MKSFTLVPSFICKPTKVLELSASPNNGSPLKSHIPRCKRRLLILVILPPMPFDLESVLARYEGLPVEDIFGVVSNANFVPPSQLDGTERWQFIFKFIGWRIGNQEIQLRDLSMRFVGSHESLLELQEQLKKHRIIHIKARIWWHPEGAPFGLFEEWVGPIQDEVLTELQRQLGQPAYFNLPSLPTLSTTGYYWGGTVHLPFWKGFGTSTADADYGTVSYLISDGDIDVAIKQVERQGTFPGPLYHPPTPAQIAALNYFIENQETISQTVFQAICNVYPEWKDCYGGEPEDMPALNSPEELKSMIQLRGIDIPLEEREGMGYILYHFSCDWDPEHGFNAATHKARLFYLDYSDPIYSTKDDARLAEG